MNEKRLISYHSVQRSKCTPKKSVQRKRTMVISMEKYLDSESLSRDYRIPRSNIPLKEKNTVNLSKISFDKEKKLFRFQNPQASSSNLINNRYDLKNKIGEGTFSCIFSAFDYSKNTTVAFKILKNQNDHSPQEIEILKFLSASFGSGNMSCELIDTFLYLNQRVLVFPFYYQSLASLIASKKLSAQEIIAISIQILHGICQIHSKNIIHRDLKPENIMVVSKNSYQIKIIDYGLASFKKDSLQTYVQTRYYRAPEVILGYPYKNTIDIWSFGCILVEMFTGSPMFKCSSEEDLFNMMIEKIGQPPEHFINDAPRSIPIKRNIKYDIIFKDFIDNKVALDVLKSCLVWDPAKRITAKKAFVKFRSAKKPTSMRKSII